MVANGEPVIFLLVRAMADGLERGVRKERRAGIRDRETGYIHYTVASLGLKLWTATQ